VLATTPFSFINIYLALKTSRNNAVVDLSESKNSEKRVIKEADFQRLFPKVLVYYKSFFLLTSHPPEVPTMFKKTTTRRQFSLALRFRTQRFIINRFSLFISSNNSICPFTMCLQMQNLRTNSNKATCLSRSFLLHFQEELVF